MLSTTPTRCPMSLSGVSSQLSSDGKIQLCKGETVIQSLLLKPAEKQHRSFILSTWVKSYEGQARRQGIGPFYATHEPAVAESRWQDCTVATDDDGYTVYAWVCGDHTGALWHCYVAPELRRLRIATRLIEHACGSLREYARPWPYSAHARVNPYLLRTK